MFDASKSVVQNIQFRYKNKCFDNLFIKRDDLIDHFVSGNKWRKLKYNIQHVLHSKKKGILTFGGAFSNHLLASASAAHHAGLKSIGMVRGEELSSTSNDLLCRCHDLGMTLQFLTREEYNRRSDYDFKGELSIQFPDYLIVPEGGANYHGIIGCQEILLETENDYDFICVAQGTTTTSIGLALSISHASKLIVIPVLKGFDSKKEMYELMRSCGFEESMVLDTLFKVEAVSNAHFGGYGKYDKNLLDFMEDFFTQTSIPIDPVYTGKALYGMIQYLYENELSDKKVVFIHTGGVFGGKTIADKENRIFY